MKIIKSLSVGLLVLFFLASSLSVGLTAQEMSKEDQEMMKKMQAYATPGANHKYLEQFTGNWTAAAKSWMKPGAPPMESTYEVEAEMLLGGRYFKMYLKGEMMGMPFKGIMLTGYDNFKKKFLSIFFDSMGTGFYKSSGTLDKSGKVRTETGLWDDIMTGGKSKVKMVYTTVNKDKYTFEMIMIDNDGKEFKNMEMVYTRKK
jgi:hypothetical protein